jgi:hypothetical protein
MSKTSFDRKALEGQRVEEAIFAALHGAGAEVSMVELLERLGNRGLSDEGLVKAAITRLLAQSRLAMTPRRRIHLP